MARRLARVAPLSRTRLPNRLAALSLGSPETWPVNLRCAWDILIEELSIPCEIARPIMVESVTAAHECAVSIDRRALDVTRDNARKKVSRGFKRLAACTRRAPTALRCSLDEAIGLAVGTSPAELNTIEGALRAAAEVFKNHPNCEPALTALDALSMSQKGWIGIIDDLHALHPGDQNKYETAIDTITVTQEITAFRIFEALASAVDVGQTKTVTPDVASLIVNYVVVVARAWSRNGLHPTRARHFRIPRYRSRFHRFTDLVLSAYLDPLTERHDDYLKEIRSKPWKNKGATPREKSRSLAWQVSEDHVRKALGTGKKTPPELRKRFSR